MRQASGALSELAQLMPDEAERVTPDGDTERVASSDLRVGDVVLVRPGASVPADGEVVEGASDVNEAMITGESRPVRKEVGNKVIAGTVNGDGSLRVRVTATGEETSLSGIMRLVQEAQQSKSATQKCWPTGLLVGFFMLPWPRPSSRPSSGRWSVASM